MSQNKHVKIKRVSEPFGEVELENGSIHAFRTTVISVIRIFNDDGTPATDKDGTALYGLNTNLSVATVEQSVDKKKAN